MFIETYLDKKGFNKNNINYLQIKPYSRLQYKQFIIPKKNGQGRLIEEPLPTLKAIQRALLLVWRQVPLHSYVYGLGSRERDAISNAVVHNNSKIIIKMDIEKFFPNTTINKILWTLDQLDLSVNFLHLLKETLKYCFVYSKTSSIIRLPTGAPTSPIISSVTFTLADKALFVLAQKYNLIYTRYIDDLTFSGKVYPSGLQKEIINIVTKYGYAVNHKKSQVLYKSNNSQMITGVCVNQRNKLSVGRHFKRRLRAMLDQHARHNTLPNSQIEGMLNYVGQVNPLKEVEFRKYFLKRKLFYTQAEYN